MQLGVHLIEDCEQAGKIGNICYCTKNIAPLFYNKELPARSFLFVTLSSALIPTANENSPVCSQNTVLHSVGHIKKFAIYVTIGLYNPLSLG